MLTLFSQMPMSLLYHKQYIHTPCTLRHIMPHILHTYSVPWHTDTFSHIPVESLNHDIQGRAIITRQMNTWRQSGLGRGAEQSGATEVMISGTKRQTWENRFKSQPQGHTTPQAWPWRTFWNTQDHLSVLLCNVFMFMCKCVLLNLWVCSWVCACSCMRVCCVQRQTCPRGRKTLEIGYCITEAIYLFWGLTYLIPLLNPIAVNALAFPIIWLSVSQRESGLLLLPVTGFSMQVAEL